MTRIVILAWTIPLTSSISISCLFNQCLHAFSLSLSGVSVSMSSSRSVTPEQATPLAVLLPPSPLCILSLSVSCSFSGDSMVTVRDRLSRVGLPALWEISLTVLSVAVVLSRCFRHFWSMFLSLSQRKTPPPGSSGVQHHGRQSRVLLPQGDATLCWAQRVPCVFWVQNNSRLTWQAQVECTKNKLRLLIIPFICMCSLHHFRNATWKSAVTT